MKNSKLLLVSALLFFVENSWAVIPENGWWWNDSESGRGFNIEIQNNLLFFSAFGYDSTGAPSWMVAGGPMTSDRDWSAGAVTTTRGQCYGCPYVAPQLIPAGTVTLHFTSSQTAVLTIGGASINVKREDFWANEITPDAMLGEWSAVIGAASDIFDGERIDYSYKTTSNGIVFAAGSRLGSTASLNPAVAAYIPSGGYWQALLDSSSGFYRLFRFTTTGFNRVEGLFWIYPKGGNPTGSGTFYQAFRTASAAFLQAGNGPASSKAGVMPMSTEQKDTQLFEAIGKRGGVKTVDAEIIRGVRDLENALRQLQGAD